MKKREKYELTVTQKYALLMVIVFILVCYKCLLFFRLNEKQRVHKTKRRGRQGFKRGMSRD